MDSSSLTSDQVTRALIEMSEADPWLADEFSLELSFRERHSFACNAFRMIGFGIVAFAALWSFRVITIDYCNGLAQCGQVVP